MDPRLPMRALAVWMLSLATGSFSPSHAQSVGGSRQPAIGCESLAGSVDDGVDITAAIHEGSGRFPVEQGVGPAVAPMTLPAHCLLSGVADRRVGVGGKPYGIRFELRMPDDWNGRFLFQGGAGINGVVRPALGLVKGPAALTLGFAVVTQDAGHDGSDASFGEDQQARIDMIYRSYERITYVAKKLIHRYYGAAADHVYFMGCSEGGREALLASQRQPLEYDGVVAGDPGFLLGVNFQGEIDRMSLKTISPRRPDGTPDYAKAFSQGDLKLLADGIREQCDAADGVKDGLVDHWSACHPHLEPLVCKGKKTDRCLSPRQLSVIRAIFDGVPPVTSGFPYDTGIGQPGWQGKMSGGGRQGGDGVSSLQGLFMTPYDPSFDDNNFDWSRDAPRFEEVGSLNRTDSVMYSSFKQHGGKLLLYTGLSDFAFSAKDLVAYYQRLAQANGGLEQTQRFARLFLVPGMTHCGGGQALDEFDPLAAIVKWVEHGDAPAALIASGRAFPGRTRPLCAYPAETHFKGSGSPEEAANFECRVPTPRPH